MTLYHLSSVKAYLDSLSPTDVVGFPCNPYQCLVARAWQYEHDGQRALVDTTSIDLVVSRERTTIATPDEEVAYLIEFFDTLLSSAPTKSYFLLQLKEQRPDLYAYFVKEEATSDATA